MMAYIRLIAGGVRVFCALGGMILVAAVLYASDSPEASSSSATSTSPVSSSTTSAAAVAGPPVAEVKPMAEILHGTRIIDNYRWLENGASPETQKWVEAENRYTRALLDPLPGRDAIHKRLMELLSIGSVTPPQIAGRYYFYTRREGMQNQPVLYVREGGAAGQEAKDRVLVDANALAADGTVALDWFEPSNNGKYVAYGTSAGGSEMSTLHIIETKTGTQLPDTIERTRAASIAWLHDNSGFYYTRYPKKGDVPDGQEMYNRHVFYHDLGTDPDTDTPVFGEGRDAEDWPSVSLSDDGRWLLITVQEGWTKSELFLMDLKNGTPPTRVTTGKNFLYQGSVYQGRVFITTDEDAPRYRVFVADAGNYDRENWKELIPQGDAVLQGAAVFGGKLFTQYEQNASSQLRVFDLDGKKISDLTLPAIGTVFGTGGKWNRDEVFFGFHSFTFAPSIYRYDLKDGSTSLWTKVDAPSIDPSAYEVRQEWFASKDGTRVPMFVVYKKASASGLSKGSGLFKDSGLFKKDGHNPTLLTAYGGFNVSLTPSFSRTAYLWMEHGGVFAVANLRGGAEFGEDWHRAGMLDMKQNVFDDMIAAAEHLIAEKYTDKNHLAIQGGSNGGLLMGAMMTQRPDLFRAVVCQVPLLDMLHYQDFQIAKLWIPEYGSAENPEQFKWLYAYSPYHHVKAGVEYPAVLFMTADTDTRVDPMHAKKMAALMQASAKNGRSKTRPILLRIEAKAGHGAGKPVAKQIEEFTDVYSFLFWQLGTSLAVGR
jgi:prolyl oligopeptidase